MKNFLIGFNAPQVDIGLLFLRIGGAFMLLHVHGWPKVVHYSYELTVIDDPLGLGAQFSLFAAIFAEVVCPVLITVGLLTRLACLPVLAVLLVSMFIVHPQWSIAEGQFGWLLMVIFGAIALCGPGKYGLATAIGRKELA